MPPETQPPVEPPIQEPVAPAPPPVSGPAAPNQHQSASFFSEGDHKRAEFQEHLVRPKSVPLAKPEYTEQPAPVAPVVTANDQALTTEQQAYAYITQPRPKASPFASLNDSLPKRLAVMGGGILFLLVVGIVIKNLVAGSPKLDQVTASIQRQQEILHVVTNALKQPSISVGNKNFALTAQLTLQSSQGDLIGYLTNVGVKLQPEDLNLKLSHDVDNTLTQAVTNNAFNPTFQSTMQSQLSAYASGLKQAYIQDTGKKGRALLKSDYDQAQLLLTQLTSPAS